MRQMRHGLCLLGAGAFVALGLMAFPALAAGETLKVNSTPPGATVEIDGAVVGTTPFAAKYPGDYFHKPHTVFSERLEHAMVMRVSKDGYALQKITLTDGPIDWIGMTGKKHGKYFVLRADHFDLKLEPVQTPIETGRVGPIRPPGAGAGDGAPGDTGTVVVASDPPGAEIYVDGKFVGQTQATIPLLAGTHHVAVTASGRKSWERELVVMKESQVSLRAVLEGP